MKHDSPPPFRLDAAKFITDEIGMGYDNTPENREALRQLFQDAKPILTEPIIINGREFVIAKNKESDEFNYPKSALGMVADTGPSITPRARISEQPDPKGTPKSICDKSPMEKYFDTIYKGSEAEGREKRKLEEIKKANRTQYRNK
jgi:hypothetical protein